MGRGIKGNGKGKGKGNKGGKERGIKEECKWE